MIQLHQLEQFCAVASCEHMSRAAELLHIAQPTLSLNISRLEAEVGAKLFDRVGRNIVLSEYGKVFLPHAATILEELQNGLREVSELADRSRRSIYVADSILNNAGHIVRAYMLQQPKANVNHQTCICQELRMMLLQGSMDVGIAVLAPNDPMIQEFDWYPVNETRLIALMREDDPLALQSEVRLAQLQSRALEYAIHDFDGRNAFESYCASVGFSPNLVYTSIKPFLFNELTRQNGYISLLSEIMWVNNANIDFEHLEPHMNTDGIVGLPVVEPECKLIYGVLTKKGGTLSKTVQDFRDFAIEYMRGNLGVF